ncbi:protein-disulfide reductase DsbD family protein [Flavobacterium orientale]|uniref:Thiol:disulfide interchange protein DsbD n=1 Tax=Flavobacterium orientale TaxID=1756020 RepID=A0A916XVR4_9FLAO|nr:thioredoxin family protein [Flavobacterium orientale]GGD16372.1 thiol:disulfide interchange protein DsbD [Flavobacterium orientale]
MKNLIFTLLTLFAFTFSQAQILDPVKWKTSIEQKSETEFLLKFDATIQKDWHIFSQFTPEGGSLPTIFIYENSKGNYQLVGKTTESKYKVKFEEVFGVDEYLFEGSAQFQQLVKVTNPALKSIKVEVEYQACLEQCIQQFKNFEFQLPQKESVIITTQTEDTITSVKDDIQEKLEKKLVKAKSNKVEKEEEKKGLWTIFIIAFFSGFAALLTPCVFPMIPMTVSYFTKQSKDRAKGIKNAIFYGLSIIVIYVTLGSAITAIFGADSLNELSTSVAFNVIFFALLVFFAASFLGAFEIVLPNSWANKVDRQADRGGIIGIFFMALALAIVSFSCTGPIVGTLIVEAASKGGIAPIVGMLGFSSAIALPFMLFALFPGWMNSLPKSGGWLNTVKVSLGFLELAFAFKFLSNADLVLQLHWFERETFLAIWIAVFGAWALYLFGKLSLPHDSPLTHISVGRLFMGLFVLSFTIYMVPGLWGAPLKIISGFPPPLHYSESPNGVGGSGSTLELGALPKGAHSGPHGIMAFHDYKYGLAYAKEVNKPILLDFTGYACVNCRKMEDYVWSDPKILSILKNEVVLISLYVDDKKELAENEKYVSKETGKKIKTIGNKWSDFQITKYKANAQPYYLILDTDGNTISDDPASYDPDIDLYEKWLRSGIDKFVK